MKKGKKLPLLCILLFSAQFALACPVCERQQRTLLDGLGHGAGPDSSWDYLIAAVTAFIVLATLALSLKYLLRPGEQAPAHIKRSILIQH